MLLGFGDGGYSAADIALTTMNVGPDGVKELVAGWPGGGPTAVTAVEWDATPPGVEVQAQVPGMRPSGGWVEPTRWRKDEVVQVEVRVSDGGVPTLSANGVAVAGGVPGNCSFTASCPAGRACRCFSLDLATVPLAGVTGVVGLQARAVDDVSNEGLASGGVTVTRVRWQVGVGGATAVVGVVEPAVDEAGNVYVGGTTSAGADGVVAQVRRDGTVGWVRATYGAVTAAPVWSRTGNPDGGPGLFVATKTTVQAQIRALEAATGNALPATNFLCVDGSSYTARMVSLGGTVVTARDNGSQQELYLANPATGNCNSNNNVAVTGRAQLAGRPADGGQTEILIASEGIATFSSQLVLPAGTAWGPTLNSLGIQSSATRGLALSPTMGVLTQVAGGTAGVVGHNLNLSSPQSSPALAGPTANTWLGATVGRTTASVSDVYFASPVGSAGGDAYRVRFNAAAMPASWFTPTTSSQALLGSFSPTSNTFNPAHPPLVAENTLLMASTTGEVATLSLDGGTWVAAAGQTGIGPVSVSPALDVSRSLATGQKQCPRPGTLYVVSDGGVVTALIVDVPGLDGQASWPRIQHDNANSGNLGASLGPWSCP